MDRNDQDSTQKRISHGKGEDLVSFGKTSAGLIDAPAEMSPDVLTCERCSCEFVHTPQRARIGEKVYIVPPVPPTMCAACAAEVREAELAEDLRATNRAREIAAGQVVPPLYRDTANLDTLDAARASSLREWLIGDQSLYLHGIAGAGKTHTAAAVAREAVLTNRHSRVVWWNVPELLERLRHSFEEPSRAASIADEIEGADLLVLDNIGQEKPSEWVCERLFVIVNRRYERGERVIVTSELDLDELADKIGRNIARRFDAMSVQVHMPKIYGGAS